MLRPSPFSDEIEIETEEGGGDEIPPDQTKDEPGLP